MPARVPLPSNTLPAVAHEVPQQILRCIQPGLHHWCLVAVAVRAVAVRCPPLPARQRGHARLLLDAPSDLTNNSHALLSC